METAKQNGASTITPNYRKASPIELVLGSANNGVSICFYMLAMMASYIASSGYGIATALVGLLLTGTRIFDGFTDGLISAIFDKINVSKGKIRIFLLGGWLVEALGVILMYHWGVGKFTGVAGVVAFVAFYSLYIIGYTMNGVGGGVAQIVLTNDPKQRPLVGTVGTMYSYVVPMVLSTVSSFVILPRFGNQFNAEMLKVSCYLYAFIALFFVALACIGLRKVDVQASFTNIKTTSKKAESPSIKDMLKLLKDNRALQMYMVAGVSDKIAQQTSSQTIVVTMVAGILIGSYQANTVISNFSTIIGIAFAILGGILAGKWGAKKTTTCWSWIAIGIAVLTVAFMAGVDTTSIGVFGIPMIIYAVLRMLTAGASMCLTTANTAMRADVVDYELERSGNYLPGVVSGVYSLIDKLVSSLGSTIATFGVAAIGYTTTLPQAGDPATPELFWMTMLLMFGLPVLGWICSIVAMKFYELDKGRMQKVQENIHEMKEAARAAQA